MIQIFSNICIPLTEQQVRLAATTAVDRVVAASRTLSETGFNATTPASSLGRHGCSWSNDLQGHKRPRRWLWSSGKARSVHNSRLRGDVAGTRGRVVGRVRLSGRAAGTAGAAASAGMPLLANRCWPCRPVFGKVRTGRDVRILSVDEEGGRANNLRKISVRHTSAELQGVVRPPHPLLPNREGA